MSVIPHRIRVKLDEVRETLRGYLWWRCLLMILVWFLLVFWLGAAIDYLPVRIGASETPRAARIVMLIILAGGIGWLLFGWLIPRWLTRIEDSSLALLIEKHHPSIANELVTSVELSGKDASVSDPRAHEAMLLRVFEKAEQSVLGITVDSLFNWRPIRRLRILVIIGVLASAVVAVAQWGWFSQWCQRFFALSDQPWPRQAMLRVDFIQMKIPAFSGQVVADQLRLEFQDGLVHVPSGESLLLQISADAAAVRVPESCTLYYRSDDGSRGRANLRRIGSPFEGWQQFHLDGPPLDSVSSNLQLDVVGLDARLRNLRLQVVDRIVVTDLSLECQYPMYLMDSMSVRAETETIPYRAGLRIQEGTVCKVIGRCNAALNEVQFCVQPTNAANNDQSPEIRKAEVSGSVFQIPLGILREGQLVEIRLVDQFGLTSDQVLRYNFTVTPDLVPEVESRLEGIGSAITPRAYLPVRGTIVDDYAVAEVLAEVSVDEASIPAIPLQLDERNLAGEVDFLKLAETGMLNLSPGMTIGMNVIARDFYNLDDDSHVGRGQPVQLAVVSQDQLLVLLDRNELELRQRLEQIISELEQLRDALRILAASLSETPQPAASETSESQPDRQAMLRLAVLRAQQAQLQCDKSRQELSGVVNRVEHLRLQLVHNRIDSLDRQQRLNEQVQSPLTLLLQSEYVGLEKHISDLQSATMAGNGQNQATLAADALDKILMALEAIKSNMMDIESFNELIDLVRGLLDEQERVLKETQETQKSRVLDLLK